MNRTAGKIMVVTELRIAGGSGVGGGNTVKQGKQ